MGNSDSRNARKVRGAIRQNDAATLQKLVKQKIDLDLAINHYSRNTPLILAACYASVDVIPTLLKSSRDKDAYNAEGHTALDKAIMFYSLANEYHPNKTKELLRRRRIVQLLIDGGVTRVRSAELELWIRVNKSDPVFIHTITHLFCRSSSVTLKSVGFAVMLRINADLTCAACFLEAGATYRNYKLMYLSDLPSIDYKMPVNLAVLILQSTCDSLILQHIENIFLSAYPATKTKDEAREEILQLLLQNDHTIRYSHQKQYPEYDGLIEYHKHSMKSLKWLCRRVIRRNAYPNVFFAVHQLDLPKKLENYVLLNEEGGGEDPTLNASKNLNMGSNPPSAQIVRRRPRPPSEISNAAEISRPRARPFSHFHHPADEIEKRRHRFSHSSVPSSPICPTASLAATSDFSPVKRRLRNQNTPYRQRPRSQAVARRDMPIIQLSPILTRKVNTETEKVVDQEVTDGKSSKQQSSPPEKINVKLDNYSNQKNQKSDLVHKAQASTPKVVKENTPEIAKMSPMIPVRKIVPGQFQGKPVVNKPNAGPVQTQTQVERTVIAQYSTHSATVIQNRKQLEKTIIVQSSMYSVKATPQKPLQVEQVIKLVPKTGQVQSTAAARKPNEVQSKEFQNIAVPRPTASTKVVSSINQPVLSTFAPQVIPSMSPRRSPRDAKRPRPHSQFIPASEVRNIFPPPNMSPQVQSHSDNSQAASSLSRSYTEGSQGGQRIVGNQMMSQSYHAPGRLADHMEYDVEFANHLEEALMKRQSQASDNAEPDPEFGSHLEEALMRRRSQPPGHFLPTKEVLIDFGTPTDSPHASRSAGSTLNRQEVLLRPGSASLPRTDSNRRRSRCSPPSSPFNLKVNPRFIVASGAGPSSSTNNVIKPNTLTVTIDKAKTKETSSDSDYDEIEDSSNSSDEETPINENEGYTRF